MLRHLVMWKIKENALGKTKTEICAQMQQELMSLPAQIKEIKHMDVVCNSLECPQDNYDVMLDTQFETVSDLNLYQQHPAHIQVGSFIKQVVAMRACIDYTI